MHRTHHAVVVLLAGIVVLLVAGASPAAAPPAEAQGASPPDAVGAVDWLGDTPGHEVFPIAAEPAEVDTVGVAHLAMPPGHPLDGMPANEAGATERPDAIQGAAATEEWHVDDGKPTLHINLAAGPTHGFANRFDPSDLADRGDGPPRPLVVRKIHFLVNGSGEPSGPMEWHIWEDNGGHKADVERDMVPPFTVTGRPGENVIDLEAMGLAPTVDPPRMFEVGVAKKVSEAGSPDVLLDDGLPFVGDSGDFHASVSGTAIGASPTNMYCGMDQWVILSASLQGETSPRSPAWMVWLEVEWQDPPERLMFDQVAGPGAPAGAFSSASRVAWGDYDGDGLEDLLASGSTLYRNMGDGTFTDVTASAGITDTGNGAIWGDYDNDGDLDFFQYTPNCVPCQKPSPDNYDDLWRNNGDGTFTNVRVADYGGAADAPVPRDPYPTEAAAWGDFNGDGYLDLYAANHVDWDSGACFDDFLWLNEGPPGYGFRDVSVESGIRAVRLCGRGVSPGDFDSDGDEDIFVSNYRLNPDLLWVNAGNDPNGVPRFTNEAGARGVEGVTKTGRFAGSYGHSIGAAWGDLDRDGDQDLVVANLAHSAWRCFSDATMVYLSSGWQEGYAFTDYREASGVPYVETHSDPSLVDIDNDGWLDLFITQVYDGWRASLYRNATGDRPPGLVAYLPSLLKRGLLGAAAPEASDFAAVSRASGADAPGGQWPAGVAADRQAPVRFQEVTHLSGIYPRTSWGSGWSDFDNDGDQDLAAQGLWRNTAANLPGANHWLQVAAVGCGNSNRDALGARVGVRVARGDGTEDELWSEVTGARGTGSQDSRVRQIGLGHGTATLVRVIFPSGASRTMVPPGADRRVTVTELGAYIRPSAWQVAAGQTVTLTADMCGESWQAGWDLDQDGSFDDAQGPTASWVPMAPGRAELAVQVTDGTARSVSRITVEVSPAGGQ
jgi:hypothetical protein